MHRRSFAMATLLLAPGCVDTPMETSAPAVDPAGVPAAALAAPTCTKTWANGIGGLWADPMRWAPVGVPGASDDVCIASPGRYDILATQAIAVRSLVIGGNGANVTLDFDPPVTNVGISASAGIGILPGSELNLLSKGLLPLSGGFLANFGTLDVDNVCACGGDVAIFTFDRVDNLKRMELASPIELDVPLWTNGTVGVIVTSGQGTIDRSAGPVTLRNWGSIVGSRQIEVSHFDWRSGTVGTTGADASVVLVKQGTINLSSIVDAASGRVDGDTDQGDLTIVGRVPAQVTVGAVARAAGPVRTVATGAGGLFPLAGALEVTAESGSRLEFQRLAVDGTLHFAGTGDVALDGDALDLYGRLEIEGPTLAFTRAGGTLRHAGGIYLTTATTLTMFPATLLSAERSYTHPALTLVLDHAWLSGDGGVGHVTSIGGTIEPGLYGRIGVGSFTLDGTSELIIPSGDDGGGEVYATGAVTLGGTLRLRHVEDVAGTGICGDEIAAIRHPNATPAGAFTAVLDLDVGTSGHWRVASLPDRLIFAGYDPTRDVAVRVRTSAVEGEEAALVEVCLGTAAPAADVVVATSPLMGQLIAPPDAVFDVATWAAPLAISIDAVDDAVIEPLQWDTVTFDLTSADPRYDGPLADRPAVAILDNDGSADLEIVVQNAPTAVNVGATFEVVYRVTNHGPTLFTGGVLVLGHALGVGSVDLEQAFGATCATDPVAGDYCLFGGGNPGESLAIALVYRATAPGDVTVGAWMRSYQPDPDPANDQPPPVQIVVN